MKKTAEALDKNIKTRQNWECQGRVDDLACTLMSYRPRAFGCLVPTSCVLLPLLPEYHATSAVVLLPEKT